MLPPGLLKARADTSDLAVNLTWGSGSSPDPIIGYRIQKKNGLPTDTSNYVTIAETNSSTFSFIDEGVELNKIYTYHISTLSGPSGGSSIFSNEATAYVPPVVPVELLSFTSSVIDNDITLHWSTATEINNSGFEIEREQVSSPQSSVSNGGWQTIGFIPGHGTTSEKQSYSFKDENLSSGKYLYRLKQIDYDGSFEYSNTIEVEITSPLEFSLEQNYPNPFNPTTKISYSIPVNSFVQLKIYDLLGGEVAILVNEEKQAGVYEVEFNPQQIMNNKQLTSGIYFYQLRSGFFIQTKKLVLVK
ncbi:MAG: T9SS type A sorting domain-containing protein [Ignavibacteriales bacterium]|nr:T9SS type A sorting domain-containing protein [Ignavibacteriales bacterium]